MFPTSNKHVKYWCFGGGSKTRDRFFVLQKTSREFLGTEIMQWAKMQQPVSENVDGCFQNQGGKHIKWTCGVKNWSATISYSIILLRMLDLPPIDRSFGFAAGLKRPDEKHLTLLLLPDLIFRKLNAPPICCIHPLPSESNITSRGGCFHVERKRERNERLKWRTQNSLGTVIQYVQISTKRLVRGCENFLPALA